MKHCFTTRLFGNLALSLFVMLACSFSCHAQNGPTNPSVTLTWVASTTSGTTANCIYRGTVAGTYTLPALFCTTAPATSWTDTTLTSAQRGTTFHYAVTAKFGPNTESPYSNDAPAPIPVLEAPTMNPPTENGANSPPTKPDQQTAKKVSESPATTADSGGVSSPGGLKANVNVGSK